MGRRSITFAHGAHRSQRSQDLTGSDNFEASLCTPSRPTPGMVPSSVEQVGRDPFARTVVKVSKDKMPDFSDMEKLLRPKNALRNAHAAHKAFMATYRQLRADLSEINRKMDALEER